MQIHFAVRNKKPKVARTKQLLQFYKIIGVFIQLLLKIDLMLNLKLVHQLFTLIFSTLKLTNYKTMHNSDNKTLLTAERFSYAYLSEIFACSPSLRMHSSSNSMDLMCCINFLALPAISIQ